MKERHDVRAPVAAGTFYPSDGNELRHQISNLLKSAGQHAARETIRGVIAPHAGYAYSGVTAAHAYALLRGRSFETVIVVAPSHREFFRGVSVYSGMAYETPLGVVEVDTKVRDALAAASRFVEVSERGHHAEHALEVQLPFLQAVLPPFRLVPIVIGDQQPEICLALTEALTQAMQHVNALLVASTDLSHYYAADIAARLDGVMIRDVEAFDYIRLMQDLETRQTEACGGGPTVAVLGALKRSGVQNIKIVHYSNSGDTTGDYGSVVGYLAAVAYS